MGGMGDMYKGEKKKMKKSVLEKKAQKQFSSSGSWAPPQVEIIKKGKKDW